MRKILGFQNHTHKTKALFQRGGRKRRFKDSANQKLALHFSRRAIPQKADVIANGPVAFREELISRDPLVPIRVIKNYKEKEEKRRGKKKKKK